MQIIRNHYDGSLKNYLSVFIKDFLDQIAHLQDIDLTQSPYKIYVFTLKFFGPYDRY